MNCNKICSSFLEQQPVRPSASDVQQWSATNGHLKKFLSRVVTSNESWLYNYDSETKQHLSGRHHWLNDKKKCGMFAATSESMVIAFLTFLELYVRSYSYLVRLSREILLLHFEMFERKMPAASWQYTTTCTQYSLWRTPDKNQYSYYLSSCHDLYLFPKIKRFDQKGKCLPWTLST